MKRFWVQLISLLKKDFQREVRTRELTTTTISFSLLLVLIASFAFFANKQASEALFPGIFWITIAFTGTLAMGRTFAMEKESGCLRLLSLVPDIWKSLYIAKLLVNLFFMVLFETILLPFLALVFDVSLVEHGIHIWGIGVLVTLGYCALGTLVSSMLVDNKLRDIMIPLLLYPLAVPLLIAGVQVTQKIILGEELGMWIRVLLGLDVLVVLISAILFRWVLKSIG